MPAPMQTGRFRRSILPLAIGIAGILGATGMKTPANAQDPYFNAQGLSLCVRGHH